MRYVSLVEQNITFQMTSNVLGSDEYQQSYKHLNILQSGPMEIEKLLIIYYVRRYKGKLLTYNKIKKAKNRL